MAEDPFACSVHLHPPGPDGTDLPCRCGRPAPVHPPLTKEQSEEAIRLLRWFEEHCRA